MFPFLLVATWRVFHALMRRHKLLWYLLSFPAIVVAVVAAAAAPSQIVVEQRQFVYLIHLPRCLGSLPPSASSSVVGISFFVRVKQSSAWQVSGTVCSSQFLALIRLQLPAKPLPRPPTPQPVPCSQHSPLFVALAELDAALCTQFSTAATATTMKRRR